MIENEEGFLRESRRDWEKLGGTWREEWWERWNSPRTPEGGLAGKGVRAARAGMGVVGGTRRGE